SIAPIWRARAQPAAPPSAALTAGTISGPSLGDIEASHDLEAWLAEPCGFVLTAMRGGERHVTRYESRAIGSADSPVLVTRRHLDDEVLRHRLLAPGAEVGDPAENVQLGHVAGGAAGRNLVADCPVAVHR